MAIQTLIKAQEVINGGIFKASPFNARFDSVLIAPYIKQAERRFLKPILCNDLYNALIAAQNSAISNYNPVVGATVQKFPNDPVFESLWLDTLLELEGYAVYYTALPFVVQQTGSNGLFENDSQFAQNSGLKGLKFQLDHVTDIIERLQKDLGDYLCNNKADFDSALAFQDKCKDCHDCGCDHDCDCEGLDSKMKQSGYEREAGLIFYDTPRQKARKRNYNKYYGKDY